jgi:uncharacterized protein YdeI (YjbR/CyaY-like superfamily)
MGTTDPRVDLYIDKAAPFAQPILDYIRAVVHHACPDVEESIKWSFPHFAYKGMLCSMAAFKNHCVFGFWKGSLILDADGISTDAMGQFGRITSVKDLPSKKVLAGYVKQAMKLNEEGIPNPARVRVPKGEVVVPDYLTKALKKVKNAKKNFDAFTPSQKRDYTEWLTEAKTDATRQRRLETAVEWIAEGKPRMWKYIKKK